MLLRCCQAKLAQCAMHINQLQWWSVLSKCQRSIEGAAKRIFAAGNCSMQQQCDALLDGGKLCWQAQCACAPAMHPAHPLVASQRSCATGSLRGTRLCCWQGPAQWHQLLPVSIWVKICQSPQMWCMPIYFHISRPHTVRELTSLLHMLDTTNALSLR